MYIFFMACIIAAVVMTVVLTALVKRFDATERLKGWRIWVPLLFSAFFAFLLWCGAFFTLKELWFWWAVIFSLSIFSYEFVIKKFKKYR